MKIFQLQDGNLIETKQESFDLEKTIQGLIEKNLDSIFPGLEFIDAEFQIDDLRPDTIAFDSEKDSFVIIEYKNIRNRALIDQGVSYHQLLHERKANFVLRYNKKMDKATDISDINWDETRVIFISPEYTKYQKRASGFQGLPIELYEIKKYQNGIVSLDRIGQSRIRGSVPVGSTGPEPTPPSEEDYLAGATEGTKKLWNQLKNKIEDTFDDIEFRQKKIYGGYYLQDGGSSVCTLEAFKTKIILSYSTSDMDLIETSEFVKDVSKVGHHGIGNFRSSIKTHDDIPKAILLIRKVYQSKKQK